jgi:hypothetical protein
MRANRSRVILLIAAYLLVVFVPSKVNRAAEPAGAAPAEGHRPGRPSLRALAAAPR